MSFGPAWLFCPADRPDRYAKAAAAADVVILDLEDALAPEARPAARRALIEHPLPPATTVIRLNPSGTPDHHADLEALRQTAYTTVMLAKTESAQQISDLAPLQVIALVETPRGVLEVAGIAAAANTAGLMWGAEDLIAGLGGTSSRRPDGRYRDVALAARSAVLLAAGAHGRFRLDAVHLDIKDQAGLRSEVDDAAASGFDATACIHPSQVPVVREGYRPPAAELDWARRVLAAGNQGVFTFEGRMIDAPVLRHAEALVRRART
ncbi:CoA ester lyase [Kineosporia rhizophila]|uniref:HpcH/HpaI aldolase/citrate lyase family protein n=1 Tax=Kineosporia TaxID=49184 RepID=UPI001E45FEB8|nr:MULTISPECIES: CoA ester lyase [Kineosporia]MCE0539685.1 CoA ester lyase [Kineosporia rhizophila]GLY16421.1 citrate lyase subunit beta-like protein [Kineosporia sp. NBRC 101677]